MASERIDDSDHPLGVEHDIIGLEEDVDFRRLSVGSRPNGALYSVAEIPILEILPLEARFVSGGIQHILDRGQAPESGTRGRGLRREQTGQPLRELAQLRKEVFSKRDLGRAE